MSLLSNVVLMDTSLNLESRVSEVLLLALQTLSLSFLTNNSSSDSKAFLCFIAFSGSSTAVHRAMQWHSHSYKLTASHALRYCTVGKTFLNLQSQTSKFDGKTTIPYMMVKQTNKQTRKHTGNLLQCLVWQAVPPPTAKFFGLAFLKK